MTLPGLYLIERLGRRLPLIIGGLWQATWLLIFAIIGIVRPPTEYASSGVIMIVCACMFIASFACTWGPFIWVGEFNLLRMLLDNNVNEENQQLSAKHFHFARVRSKPLWRLPSIGWVSSAFLKHDARLTMTRKLSHRLS